MQQLQVLFFDGLYEGPHLGAHIYLLGYVVAVFFFDGVRGGRGEAAGRLACVCIILNQSGDAGALQKQSNSLIGLQFQGCESIVVGL